MSQVRSTEVVDADLAARDFVERGYRRRRLGRPLEPGDVAADPAAGRVLWVPLAASEGRTRTPRRAAGRRRALSTRIDQAERRLRRLGARLEVIARSFSAAAVNPPDWRAVLLPHLQALPLDGSGDFRRVLRLAEQLAPYLGWSEAEVREGIARELERRAGRASAESHKAKMLAQGARRPADPLESERPGFRGIDWMDDAEVDEC